MVQPFWPNEADAFDDNQAEPDSVDIEILLLGYKRTGVVSGCAVTEDPATPDLTVDVAVGVAILDGSQIAVSAQLNNAVTTGAGSPRVDLVTVNSSGTVVITDGTAAAEPVAPAIPANSVPLAFLYVPASDTSIANNQITDKRVVVPSLVVPLRYVDPSGADTNDGRTELTAFATIQAAYDDLAAGVTNQFVGDIYLLPGTHDVVGGVTIPGAEPVRLIGLIGSTAGLITQVDAKPVITTNNTATEHIDVTRAGGQTVGLEIRNVEFDMDGTALTAAIRIENPIWCKVERCLFYATTNPNVGVWGIEFDNSGIDNSWNYIRLNRTRGVGLLRILISGNSNVNGWNIENNDCSWADDTNFSIDVDNLDNAFVRGNDFRGAAGGIWLRRGSANTFIGNGGEGVSTGNAGHANAQYRVGDSSGATNANDNVFIGGRSTFGGAAVTTGIWIRLENTPSRNLVIMPDLRDGATTTTSKNHVDDVTTGGTDTTIIGSDSFELSSRGLTLPNLTAAPARLRDGMLWHRSDTEQIVAQVDGVTRTLGLQDALEFAVAKTLDWSHGVVNMESTAATRIVTLPDNAAFDGKGYLIRRDGSNTVTIDRAGSDTFDDADVQKTLDSDGAAIGIFSIGDGEWKIVGTEGTVGGS